MKLFRPNKPTINGNHLANNEAVKNLIDNEQVNQYEQNLRMPRGILMILAVALGILIFGFYLAWKI